MENTFVTVSVMTVSVGMIAAGAFMLRKSFSGMTEHVKKTINSFISMSSIKQSHEQLAEKYEELAEERDDLQDNQEKLLDQIASLKNIIIDYEKETILNIDREGNLFTQIDTLKHLLEIANEENVMLKKDIEKLKY